MKIPGKQTSPLRGCELGTGPSPHPSISILPSPPLSPASSSSLSQGCHWCSCFPGSLDNVTMQRLGREERVQQVQRPLAGRSLACSRLTWRGNSLVVQWLGLGALAARAQGLIPGQGTKIPQAAQRSQKSKKQKRLIQRLV